MVVPVPLGAAVVGWPGQAGNNALVVGAEFEAFVALGADIVVVEDFTVVSESDALSIAVHAIPSRTLEADLSVPVPFSTSLVRGWVIQSQVFDTDSGLLADGVASVTFDASSVAVEGLAVVIQGLANSTAVESESLRAFQAHLLFPVPLSTSQV